MLKLNLLPPQEKAILAQEQNQRWIVYYGSAILVILLIFMGLLAAIWLGINIQLKSATEALDSIKTSFKGQNLQTQQTAIVALNNYLKQIENLQTNQKSYSHLLISLAELVPDGVRLDNFSVDEAGAATLAGFAAKREQVMAFQDVLNKSGFFEKINNPLSNIVKETDITFTFTFDLKPEALKNSQ